MPQLLFVMLGVSQHDIVIMVVAYLHTWPWPDDEPDCCFFFGPAPLIDGSVLLVTLGLLLPFFMARVWPSPSGDGRDEAAVADPSRPRDSGRDGNAVRGCDTVAAGCDVSFMSGSN